MTLATVQPARPLLHRRLCHYHRAPKHPRNESERDDLQLMLHWLELGLQLMLHWLQTPIHKCGPQQRQCSHTPILVAIRVAVAENYLPRRDPRIQGVAGKGLTFAAAGSTATLALGGGD